MALSDLFDRLKMSDGQYMKIDDIIAAYPDGIHLSGIFTRTDQDGKESPCFKFAEEPNRFFYASTKMLQSIYNEMLKEVEGDAFAANEQLSKEYWKVQMERGKTKSGNKFLKVYFLEIVPADKFAVPDETVPF